MMELTAAEKIFKGMREAVDFEDETEVMLWEDIRVSALNYVNKRSEWLILSIGEKVVKDTARTRSHDVFISTLNVLARYLKEKGKDVKWVDMLFPRDWDRRDVGDFAGYFLLLCSLSER